MMAGNDRKTEPMKRETLDFINKYHMLHPGDRVVVGVSGGADSVCLLHLLRRLKGELRIELKAVHIHHGLRGAEADRDAAFSKEFCRQLGMLCEVTEIHADVEAKAQGISVEEAGRNARYRILEAEAVGWEREPGPAVKIAVAHHGDDSAETILHNLCRGSGLRGLSGIPPVRGRIIRPLLWAERKEILSYLQSEGLTYVEDSTNGENDYTRNRIRNEILPLINSAVNEKAVKNMLRAGEIMGGADRYFVKKAKEWLKNQTGVRGDYLSIPELQKEETIMQGYILREALKDRNYPLKDITGGHIDEVLSLLSKQTGKSVNLPGGISAERQYEQLRLLQRKEKEEQTEEDKWDKEIPANDSPVVSMRVFPYEKRQEIPKNVYTKWFDYDKIGDALSVRHRRTGDYITLSDGKKKTVKAFMIDEKIPVKLREQITLLTEEAHVLWIIGYRISEYYKITDDTKNILEVRSDGGMERGR